MHSLHSHVLLNTWFNAKKKAVTSPISLQLGGIMPILGHRLTQKTLHCRSWKTHIFSENGKALEKTAKGPFLTFLLSRPPCSKWFCWSLLLVPPIPLLSREMEPHNFLNQT